MIEQMYAIIALIHPPHMFADRNDGCKQKKYKNQKGGDIMQEIYKALIMHADYPLVSLCAKTFILIVMSISLEMLYRKIYSLLKDFAKI